MSNKRMYVGSATVIAVAIFIYLGFFAPNPAGEDITGTINTVQKYQTDQISDMDVMLEGEEIILDEMAELFEHATIEEQAELLGKATKEMTASLLARCDKNVQAELWGRMDKTDQVAAFNAMNVEKESFLGRAEMTMATFNRMDISKQALALHGANVKEKAAMFERAPQKAQMAALSRMDMQGRAFVMQGANVREKAMLMGRAPVLTRQAILSRMEMQGRVNLVRTASLQGRAYMFNRATLADREAMLQGASMEEKAALFGHLEIQDQINGVLARVEKTQDISMLGRASEFEAPNLFATMPPRMHKTMFGRLTKAQQAEVLGRMSLTQETFGKMHLQDQSKALMGANTKDKQAMLGKVSFEEGYKLLGKMNIRAWKSVLNRMEMQDRSESFGRVDVKIQMRALDRAPNVKAAMLERAPAKTMDYVLGRAFLNSPVVQ